MDSKKKIIAVDKDDVLVDLNRNLYQYHNETFGTAFKVEEATTFDLSVSWQIPMEEAERRVLSFYESAYFDDLLPIEGAVEAIKKLSQNYTLIVITSRPEHVAHKTQASLEKYFSGCFSAVYHINFFNKGSNKKTKAQVCLETGAQILIDDAPHNIQEAAKSGIHSLLFRRPWNRNLTGKSLKEKGIIPVESWNDAVTIIESLDKDK